MGQWNFLRRYVINAGEMGKTGFKIGETTSDNPHALHISFSIEKSSSESANTAKIEIWNLSPDNLKILDRKDCIIELQAGYDTNIALVLVGNVVTTSTSMDGADRLTEIEVVDGRVALRDTYVSISYSGKVNCKDVFDYIARQMGVPVVYSKNARFQILPNGFSFVGPAKNALKKLCKICHLSWSIQNSVLQVRKPNEPITTKGFLLSSDTGLLDVPKRITISSESDDSTNGNSAKTSQIGYEVRYLLNGAIGVNDYVRLESEEVRGYFRVYKLNIDGDNLEGDWICSAQLLEVK